MAEAKWSALVRDVREGIAPVLDFVYPPRCPICGDATLDQGGLCAPCWNELDIPEPGENSFDAGPRLAGTPIVAATYYNDISRQLVLAFKHGRRISLAGFMARLIAARLPDYDDRPLFVPVPLHRWRLWKRGYNQAALIARELAKLRGGELLVDGLVRHRQTTSLGGLNAAARQAELAGAITASDKTQRTINGRIVVLVDDVVTSGATSEECVRALKAAGAGRVAVACFARVPDGAT